MMMKTRIFFMLFAVALLWCGCSKNDDESGAPIAQTDDDDARLIRVSASAIDVTASQSTRTVVEGNAFSSQDARVLATAVSDNYAALHCNGTMTFNSTAPSNYGSISAGSSKYYPISGTVYLSGLYPADNWNNHNDLAVTNGTVTHTVDGQTDLLYAGSESSTLDAATTVLTFKHVLTLLKIYLKAETTPITVTSIILTGTGGAGSYVNTTCNVNLNTEAVTFSGGTEATILNCYVTGTNTTFTSQAAVLSTSGAEEKAYVLAPALDKDEVAGDEDYTLYVAYNIGTTEQEPVPVNLQLCSSGSTAYNANTAGKSFNITLTFKGSQITATANISPWSPGGIASGTI
jgi:hypothetical protein